MPCRPFPHDIAPFIAPLRNPKPLPHAQCTQGYDYPHGVEKRLHRLYLMIILRLRFGRVKPHVCSRAKKALAHPNRRSSRRLPGYGIFKALSFDYCGLPTGAVDAALSARLPPNA